MASTRARGLGWFGRLPATPLGAATARSLTYWVRDPRYALAIAIVPLLPVILWILNPGGSSLLFLGPTAAFFMGWGISADVAYDGSAFWTHVAAPVTGLTDRLGRVLGASALAVPVVVVYAVGLGAADGPSRRDPRAARRLVRGPLHGVRRREHRVRARRLPGAATGGEPVPDPAGRVDGGGAVAARRLVGGARAEPARRRSSRWIAITQHDVVVGWATLVVGPLLGGLLLFLGVRIGGRLLERNGTDLLRRILSFA